MAGPLERMKTRQFETRPHFFHSDRVSMNNLINSVASMRYSGVTK